MTDRDQAELAVSIAYALMVAKPRLPITEARRYQIAGEVVAHLTRCGYVVNHPATPIGPRRHPGPSLL